MSLEELRNKLDKFPVGSSQSFEKVAYQIEHQAKQSAVLVQMWNGAEWVVPKGSTEAEIIHQFEQRQTKDR